MNELQQELRPILTPLIAGNWTTFNEFSEKRIALWLAMTSTVIAMSWHHTLGVTTSDSRYIKEVQAVPDGWQMWIGRGSGFSDVDYCNRAGTLTTALEFDINRIEPNIAVTTIALGQLLLHSINVPIPEVMPSSVAYGRSLGIYPIHPTGSDSFDWRLIPIIHNGTVEWDRLKDEFRDKVLLKLMGPA